MEKYIKIELISLLSAGLIWYFFLQKKQSVIGQIIEVTPYLKEQKNQIFQEAGVEILKIAGTYLLISNLRKNM